MPIYVTSILLPKNSGYYPVVDSPYVRGGYRSVATTGSRDAIPSGIRATGLLVHVQDNGYTYILASGISNDDWLRYGANSFTANFASSGLWTINHNLGYLPTIQLLDTSGNMLFGQITHNSINQSLVSFNTPFAGSVYCS